MGDETTRVTTALLDQRLRMHEERLEKLEERIDETITNARRDRDDQVRGIHVRLNELERTQGQIVGGSDVKYKIYTVLTAAGGVLVAIFAFIWGSSDK